MSSGESDRISASELRSMTNELMEFVTQPGFLELTNEINRRQGEDRSNFVNGIVNNIEGTFTERGISIPSGFVITGRRFTAGVDTERPGPAGSSMAAMGVCASKHWPNCVSVEVGFP